MIQNKNKYNIVKERQSDDVTIITYTKKERKCDGCLCIKRADKISLVKYPIIHRDMGRLIMEKKLCDDCYEDYREIKDNLKYN
tara:strand:- start:342 stop:590 length:249 start_codon:yes stop_codon:yes gene_type:complete